MATTPAPSIARGRSRGRNGCATSMVEAKYENEHAQHIRKVQHTLDDNQDHPGDTGADSPGDWPGPTPGARVVFHAHRRLPTVQSPLYRRSGRVYHVHWDRTVSRGWRAAT